MICCGRLAVPIKTQPCLSGRPSCQPPSPRDIPNISNTQYTCASRGGPFANLASESVCSDTVALHADSARKVQMELNWRWVARCPPGVTLHNRRRGIHKFEYGIGHHGRPHRKILRHRGQNLVSQRTPKTFHRSRFPMHAQIPWQGFETRRMLSW